MTTRDLLTYAAITALGCAIGGALAFVLVNAAERQPATTAIICPVCGDTTTHRVRTLENP